MTLTSAQKKQYRAIAHALNPVIIVGDKGLNEGLLQELNRALNDHELIKVKVAVGDREGRALVIDDMCQRTGATLVQCIGKVAVIVRQAEKPNPTLSNLLKLH